MPSIIFKYPRFFFISLVIALVFISCKKDSIQLKFEIGSDLIDVDSRISICDTFSIELSTVQTDSTVTSGLENLLVGKLNDSRLGNLTSKCYFRINLPSEVPFIEGDVYDSISMIIKLNGYYCGDTTIQQSWDVYRLIEDMETNDDGYLYNNSSFMQYDEILGNVHFKAYPAKNQKVEIPLNYFFGKSLYNLYINEDETIESISNFQDYLKGFAIEASGNNLNTILGINTNDTSVIMRIYGHRIAEEKIELHMDFNMETGSLPFSQIICDRSNTMLSGLINQKTSLSSTQTSNEAYIQGGTGLLTRIDIPNLAKVLEIENAVLMKAELILKPVLGTFENSELPTSLVYSKVDKKNNTLSIYYNSENVRISGPLVINDALYNENTYYSLDITSYVTDELSDSYFVAGSFALLLSYASPGFSSTTSSIVFGDINHKNQKAKLKLYFLYYE